ncbi:ABC transporter [Phytophthora megakarya]|uniref:ABC transporter n=1 Tax=Phytophthora megakarya TaxID=4795 RepID=A0A225WI74_9STRA|nr:ABC transporter [Phytophthora megakarya]
MSGSEPESQVPGGNWVSPPVDVEWHESWEAFSAHIGKHYKRTHQIFRQRTSTSVAKRNREITARAARLMVNGGEAQAGQLIPEYFVNVWIKLVCTHGWSRKSRSNGIRESCFDRDTGCKANIKAGVSWNDAEKKFMVHVTDSCVTHNHQISTATVDNHASNRRVDDPSVLAFVDQLQAAGSKSKLIMQYETGASHEERQLVYLQSQTVYLEADVKYLTYRVLCLKSAESVQATKPNYKNQRNGEGRKTANKLVQGKLAPVQRLGSVMDILCKMDIYEEAHGVLAVITKRSLPKPKKAIAGKFNEDDCEADIRYVSPQVFVKKTLSAIRVFLKSLSDKKSLEM